MGDPADLRTTVVRRRDACVKFKDGKPASDRKEALQFYRGDNLDLYGDSGDGLSTVVSRDTMEAVESLMPALLRPFVAGEEVVSFEPFGPEDEESTAQATDFVNHVFRAHNNSLHVVQDALKDGLLFRLGVAKTVVEEEEVGSPETYDDLDEPTLEALRVQAQQQGREVAGDIGQDPATGLFSATLQPRKAKRFRVHVIAPEEFLYEEQLASLSAATFLGHSKQVTAADLIDMGVDEKTVKSLGSGKPKADEERQERFEGENYSDEWDKDDLSRPIWVDECYIKCAYDGVVGWRKVLLGGSSSKLLLDEEADDHPYSAWTPVPIPHKLVGLSVHDLVRDVQMQKTALQREILNNIYLTNRPMREVVDEMVNIDDLLNPSIGGLARVKQPGMIRDMVVPFVAEKTFGVIEYLDTVREARTGVTRYNQGMDSNSLNKTATGMSIITSASQQRQELIARQFGEFLKDVFGKMLRLIVLHAGEEEVARLRGQFVPWPEEYDMSVSVGLGTNNKDQLVGHIMALLQLDERIIGLQQGINGPLLTAPNVHEKLKRLTEAMGLKGAEKYYSDPAEMEAQAPPQGEEQPDPLAEPKLKAETDIAEARIKQETELQKAQMQQQVVVPFGGAM